MALFKYYAGAMVPDPFTFNQASGQYSANPTSAGRLGIMDQDLAYALDQKGYSMAMMTAQYSGDFDPGKVIVQAGSLSPQIVSDLMDLGVKNFYFDEPGNPNHDTIDAVNNLLPVIHGKNGYVWVGDCIECPTHTPHWGLLQNVDYVLCDNYDALCSISDVCLQEVTTSNSTAIQNIYNEFKRQLGQKFVGAFVCSDLTIWGYLNTVFNCLAANVGSPWVFFYSNNSSQDSNIDHLSNVAWSDYHWLLQKIREYQQQFVALAGVNWAPDGSNGYSTVGSADYPITQLTPNPDGSYADPTGKIVTVAQFWAAQQTGSYTGVWQ